MTVMTGKNGMSDIDVLFLGTMYVSIPGSSGCQIGLRWRPARGCRGFMMLPVKKMFRDVSVGALCIPIEEAEILLPGSRAGGAYVLGLLTRD